MIYKCFEVSVENKIAHIVLNRPEKRNSMIPEFWDELPVIVNEIDQDALARVIVISSTGKHFSAGMDLSVFGDADSAQKKEKSKRDSGRQKGSFYKNLLKLQETFTCLEECRVPVLVAIQGGVIGGGVDLITACDMRYMTAESFLTIFEINIGMTADVGTFPRITKLLPEGVVKELAYTGRRMSAPEAKSLGFVNEIFSDQESLLAGVMKIAQQIASKAPLAIYGSKRIINYSRDHSTADSLDYIGIWNASMLQNAEIMEAMTAATEKRPAEFVDIPKKRRKMGSGIID